MAVPTLSHILRTASLCSLRPTSPKQRARLLRGLIPSFPGPLLQISSFWQCWSFVPPDWGSGVVIPTSWSYHLCAWPHCSLSAFCSFPILVWPISYIKFSFVQFLVGLVFSRWDPDSFREHITESTLERKWIRHCANLLCFFGKITFLL